LPNDKVHVLLHGQALVHKTLRSRLYIIDKDNTYIVSHIHFGYLHRGMKDEGQFTHGSDYNMFILYNLD
ncbi:hypothetical protein ACJX0J_021459, partial [Zea mays]